MSIIGSNILAGSSGQGGGYEIEQSLRFDRGGYFSRTFSSSGDRNNWTFSVWLKRSGGIGDNDRDIFCGYSSGDRLGLIECGLGYPGGSADQFGVDRGGDASAGVYYTNGRYRDPSAWYHLVVSVDYTNATQANRARIFINGVNYGAAYNDLASGDGQINGNWSHWIGQRDGGSTSNRWDGYMAELHFLDGITVTDALDFGEFDNNGVWRPIAYTGSYNTNGFYLKFDPSATNGIGHDHSGNGNNWTPTGFTTSGIGTDVMSDTPTTNWATLNAVDPSSAPLSEGNLKVTGTSGGWSHRRSTFAMSSGKWYWEATVFFTGSDYSHTGVVKAEAAFNNHVGQNAYGWGFQSDDGKIYNNGSGTSYGSGVATGTVLGVAFDADTGKMWVRNASGYYNSGDPAAGTNPAMTAGSGTYFAAGSAYPTSAGDEFNFGQRAFAYTPPTGYKALNTANLPAPTVKDGGSYFDTVTYSGATSGTAGAGTTQTVTGLGFSPDLVWIKNRSNANSHGLFDQVRGAVNALRSDLTNAEATTNSSGALSAFNSNGFTLANGSSGSDQAILTHQSGYTYVAWSWDAGGSGSSNTDGTITSTVSANPSAGFSIATYTGTGTAGTVGHGLGVAPRFVIVRKRSGGTMGGGYSDWLVYSQALVDSGAGSDAFLYLNTTGATSNSSSVFGSAPTSTVFNIGNNQIINNSSSLFVAYCFAEVEGYSKFGSYSSEMDTAGDGPFVLH
jgi:hypothetical protein